MAQQKRYVTDKTIGQTIDELCLAHPGENRFRIERGVTGCASLWLSQDGSQDDFKQFCLKNFKSSPKETDAIYKSFSRNLEYLNGYFNKMTILFREPLDLDKGDYSSVDELFGGYNAGAHWMNDFYCNKTAFIIILNFPAYTLQEKNNLGRSWSAKEWAYARLGDLFRVRVPSQLLLDYTASLNKAEMYISSYNIMAGRLVDETGSALFSEDTRLLSHWNLRDEIKSCYSGNEKKNILRQRMLSMVMQRIVDQSIPACVINNSSCKWNPYTNEVFVDGRKKEALEEGTTRYSVMLELFHQLQRQDEYYNDNLNTHLKRNFEKEMEIPLAEAEKLFVSYLSSPQVKSVSQDISKRLKRKLEPFDIWYDGFKQRSDRDQTVLSKITAEKYPDAQSFQKDMPQILKRIGFSESKANYLCDKILIEPARGSGHAAGAQMRGDKARLRTRISSSGMDYKGYNIAIHEFGHNVEQTLSLYDVEEYLLNGVPNTAFTEALAFMFQSRDLELLGVNTDKKDGEKMFVLDNFWSLYEIIGVSLVDIRVWKWLYANPEATPAELKQAVIRISRDVWNSYYAPVLGRKDQLLLGIYSHMIAYPLYLSAYSFGHLIQFQLEGQISGKNFGEEVERIFTIGRVTPEIWMLKSTGKELSVDPLLRAVDKALKN